MKKLSELKELKKLKGPKELNESIKVGFLSCLLATGVGMGAGVLVAVVYHLIFSVNHGFGQIVIFLLPNLFPISVLIFLFILSKKNYVAWKNIKTRMLSIVILSIVYMYSFYFVLFIASVNNLSSIDVLFSNSTSFILIPLFPIYMFLVGVFLFFMGPLQLQNHLQSPLLIVFLYLNIFVLVAAYFATKGIADLLKRIILFLIIGFLICITTVTLLIPSFMFR